jgi:hypothetical protein
MSWSDIPSRGVSGRDFLGKVKRCVTQYEQDIQEIPHLEVPLLAPHSGH